jgi:hypothetical protein
MRGKKMITATRTLQEVAKLFNVTTDSVAVRTGATYRRHLVINGKSLCGKINNDGYNLPTMFDNFRGFVCPTCDKKFVAKAGN